MNKKFAKIAAFASAMVLTFSATSVAYAVESSDNTETTASASNTETTVVSGNVYGGAEASKIKEFGDLNKDGEVNSKDAVKVLQFYAEKIIDKDITIDNFLSGDSKETTESTEAVTTTTDITEATTETTTSTSAETSTESTEATTETSVEKKYSLGDVNGDGAVDAKDAILILQYYADSLVGNVETTVATESTEVATTESVATTTAVTEATTVATESTEAATTTSAE